MNGRGSSLYSGIVLEVEIVEGVVEGEGNVDEREDVLAVLENSYNIKQIFHNERNKVNISKKDESNNHKWVMCFYKQLNI